MSDSRRHFPPDLAEVFGLLFAPLIIGLPLGWFIFRFGSWSLVYLALGSATVGVILLVTSRLPLYRQGRFLTLGPRDLDARHKRLYWRGYAFIVISLIFFAFALAIPA